MIMLPLRQSFFWIFFSMNETHRGSLEDKVLQLQQHMNCSFLSSIVSNNQELFELHLHLKTTVVYNQHSSILSIFSVEKILHMERSNFFYSFLLVSVVGIDFPKNDAKGQRVIPFCFERSCDSKKLSKIFFFVEGGGGTGKVVFYPPPRKSRVFSLYDHLTGSIIKRQNQLRVTLQCVLFTFVKYS